MNGVRCLPDVVVQAALGGSHRPINPHRQRLLVAAHKAAASTGNGNDKTPATTSNVPKNNPKAKVKVAKKAANTAANPVEDPVAEPGSSPEPTTSADKPLKALKQKRAPYPDTAYNIARKEFFAQFLVFTQSRIYVSSV